MRRTSDARGHWCARVTMARMARLRMGIAHWHLALSWQRKSHTASHDGRGGRVRAHLPRAWMIRTGCATGERLMDLAPGGTRDRWLLLGPTSGSDCPGTSASWSWMIGSDRRCCRCCRSRECPPVCSAGRNQFCRNNPQLRQSQPALPAEKPKCSEFRSVEGAFE